MAADDIPQHRYSAALANEIERKWQDRWDEGHVFDTPNRDGLLTADELPGGRGRTVSLAEHRESLAAMFRRQDVDRDGFLNARELAAPPR